MEILTIDKVTKYLRDKITSDKDGLKNLDKSFYEKNAYEDIFCRFFGMKRITNSDTFRSTRYGDAMLNIDNENIKIELKKSKNGGYWLDVVRYSEMILAKLGELEDKDKTKLAIEYSITIFIVTKKEQISNIFLIETSELIKFLNINKEDAINMVKFHSRHNESVNVQLALRLNNLIEGSKGILISFNKNEIIFKTCTGNKLHTDYAKSKEKENEVDIIKELIEKWINESGKDTFSADDLHKIKEKICTYSSSKIRRIFKQMFEEEIIEQVKRGRYKLSNTVII